MSPSGKATDSDSVIRGFKSLHPSQKIRQVSTCRIFLSIAKAMAYHHALACISSPKVYIISHRLHPLSQWWYTRLSPWWYTKLRFDDMHSCGVIWYVSSSPYENPWKYLFCPLFARETCWIPKMLHGFFFIQDIVL